jgi:7-cyano-7-deazaguanine tRNA-ribosyltransferase
MLVIAGLSLKNLKPRVWDPKAEYFLPRLQGIMVSYADFHAMPARRAKAIEQGLHAYLEVPRSTRIFLDNGAFYFLGRSGITPSKEYDEFVRKAKPDWYPIPQDYIPTPSMSLREQRECLQRTMAVNRSFEYDGFVPVIHVSRVLGEYIYAIRENNYLSSKPVIALGGIVPNLLRAPRALPYKDVINSLWLIRDVFAHKQLHVFGLGGTATLHLAGLMGFDSVDSSGWRNRAARGIVQLPGMGDRVVAELGNWRGRRPNQREIEILKRCKCPSCLRHGVEGLKSPGINGFCNRATHNL